MGACLFSAQKILHMAKPYYRLPFVFNYSTLILLAFAFVIARCKKDDKSSLEQEADILTIDLSGSSEIFGIILDINTGQEKNFHYLYNR